MLDFRNKVSNLEIINSLEESLVHNEDAIDFIDNRKEVVISALKYNELDEQLQFELVQLNYISFVLEHVGTLYEKSLKQLKKGRKIS